MSGRLYTHTPLRKQVEDLHAALEAIGSSLAPHVAAYVPHAPLKHEPDYDFEIAAALSRAIVEEIDEILCTIVFSADLQGQPSRTLTLPRNGGNVVKESPLGSTTCNIATISKKPSPKWLITLLPVAGDRWSFNPRVRARR